MSRLDKYHTHWKEKISLITDWKVNKINSKILDNKIELLDSEIKLLSEITEGDDYVSEEILNKTSEVKKYRRLLNELVLKQVQIDGKIKKIDSKLKSLSIGNEWKEEISEDILDETGLNTIELCEWRYLIKQFKLEEEKTEVNITEISEIFKKTNLDKLDLQYILRSTLQLKLKISENNKSNDKKIILKKIKEKQNDLEMKMSKLDKKIKCQIMVNDISYLQKRKQCIHD
ncbi:unnamed protein product [Meganyctiphanes norvegica]|uniref:Uncharacterized protein n=1 Tax=Meganyctiphanes norvegica TaxID=48144 RepID=A0AAV2PXV3_MEGNR